MGLSVKSFCVRGRYFSNFFVAVGNGVKIRKLGFRDNVQTPGSEGESTAVEKSCQAYLSHVEALVIIDTHALYSLLASRKHRITKLQSIKPKTLNNKRGSREDS